jgi:predicted RNA-binding protein YlxR (DUF448 family)
VVCRKKNSKKNMNRIYLSQSGTAEVDEKQNVQQRGKYICFDVNCHLKVANQKSLNRIFKRQISQQNQDRFLNNLKSEIKIDNTEN